MRDLIDTRRETIGSVLFGAGRGERLRPITDIVAKPALPLLDVPLGAWPLTRLMTLGAPVLVNVGHLPATVEEALAPFGDIELMHEWPRPYGSAGTLLALRDRLGPRVVTCNADLLSDLEATDVLATHESTGAPATVAVRMVSAGADLMVEGARATSLVNRHARPEVQGGIFLGMAVFERAVLDRIGDRRPAGLAERLLAPLAERGELAVHVHSGYARDVGTARSYLNAALDLLGGGAPPPPSAWPGRVIEVANGYAYAGPGAVHDDAALGAGAVLLRASKVGPGARISNAVVLPGESVPPGLVLERCVWAGGAAVQTQSPSAD